MDPEPQVVARDFPDTRHRAPRNDDVKNCARFAQNRFSSCDQIVLDRRNGRFRREFVAEQAGFFTR